MYLRLAPLGVRHLEQTLRWINNPEIAKPFGLDRHITDVQHMAWFMSLQEDETQNIWAIEQDSFGHIGNIGLKNIDRQHRSGEYWIYLSPEAQGHGFATAATELVLEQAFDALGLQKVYLHVNPDNHAALQVYERCGFESEGLLRQEYESAEGRYDMLRMGICESSWRTMKKLKPRVALMQPTFMPWLGYYELLEQADIFVFLDDFQFSRQSWGQRNQLFLSPGRAGIITLPVQHPKNIAATFLEISPAHTAHWMKKFFTSMSQSYGKAPYFHAVMPLLEEWLKHSYANLADMLTYFICQTAKYIGIRTHVLCSSRLNYERNEQRSSKISSLLHSVGARCYYSPKGSLTYMKQDALFPLKNIITYFQRHNPKEYCQYGNAVFVPYLSVVDALFNLSPSQIRKTLRGTRRWLTWEEALVHFSAEQKDSPDEITRCR